MSRMSPYLPLVYQKPQLLPSQFHRSQSTAQVGTHGTSLLHSAETLSFRDAFPAALGKSTCKSSTARGCQRVTWLKEFSRGTGPSSRSHLDATVTAHGM